MTPDLVKDVKAQPIGLRFIWLAVVVIFVWSAIRPHDYFTWMLEVFPAIIGAVILVDLSTLQIYDAYTLIAVHMIILIANEPRPKASGENLEH